MREDRALQIPQRRAWFETKVADQALTRLTVGGQRLGLTTNAIQSEHQLGGQLLAGGMRRHQGLQLTDQLRLPPELEVGFHARLQGGQPQLIQQRDVGLREGLERHLGQRRAAP